MSECIRGSYDDALYKSTYTLLYFTKDDRCERRGGGGALADLGLLSEQCSQKWEIHCLGRHKPPAKFDAASFILGREIRYVRKHYYKNITDYCIKTVDEKLLRLQIW